MVRSPAPLPIGLEDTAFAIDADGLTPWRARARDLHAPFAGVRAAHPPALTALALARDYLPRLREGQFFSHTTAGLLHGMWLPLARERELAVHVSVHKPDRAPRGPRVRGHHLIPRPGVVEVWDGVPASDPVEAWCQVGTQLRLDDLVVAGDSLVSKGRADPGRTLDRLLGAAADVHRPRAAHLRRAAALVRIGTRSAGESRTRLAIVAAGLPEPEVDFPLAGADGHVLAEGDLVYPRERIWIEYEGDGHRTDQRQFRKDIARYEWLQDLRWRVVRVTPDDLNDGRFVRRIQRLLHP